MKVSSRKGGLRPHEGELSSKGGAHLHKAWPCQSKSLSSQRAAHHFHAPPAFLRTFPCLRKGVPQRSSRNVPPSQGSSTYSARLSNTRRHHKAAKRCAVFHQRCHSNARVGWGGVPERLVGSGAVHPVPRCLLCALLLLMEVGSGGQDVEGGGGGVIKGTVGVPSV